MVNSGSKVQPHAFSKDLQQILIKCWYLHRILQCHSIICDLRNYPLCHFSRYVFCFLMVALNFRASKAFRALSLLMMKETFKIVLERKFKNNRKSFISAIIQGTPKSLIVPSVNYNALSLTSVVCHANLCFKVIATWVMSHQVVMYFLVERT